MSYSQNNEEQLVKYYFGGHVGTFLEIGANDGKTLSNCYQLALDGWGGLCVEPSPKVWESLVSTHANHPKVQCMNVAIGEGCTKAVFYDSDTLLKSGDMALVSTIEKAELKRWGNSVRFDETEVEVIDFDTMVKLSSLKQFDLISIDAEGLDWKILKQIDLIKVGCRMLIVEWNGKDKELYKMYCESFGMTLTNENGENLIFQR
jgi:FkbM family methyltransferase